MSPEARAGLRRRVVSSGRAGDFWPTSPVGPRASACLSSSLTCVEDSPVGSSATRMPCTGKCSAARPGHFDVALSSHLLEAIKPDAACFERALRVPRGAGVRRLARTCWPQQELQPSMSASQVNHIFRAGPTFIEQAEGHFASLAPTLRRIAYLSGLPGSAFQPSAAATSGNAFLTIASSVTSLTQPLRDRDDCSRRPCSRSRGPGRERIHVIYVGGASASASLWIA